jgi:methylated-DNA-[protein]-cysteine S-methyltransferase
VAKAPGKTVVNTLAVPFPLGKVTVRLGSGGGVEGVEFDLRRPRGLRGCGRPSHPVARALRDYLAGRSRVFSPPVCGLSRFSSFDREVWRATRAIPPGQTRTYGQIAAAVGRPGGARAVGGALSRNPAPLAIPCHRVVGAGGSLGGFSSGLALKRWLLELEAGPG